MFDCVCGVQSLVLTIADSIRHSKFARFVDPVNAVFRRDVRLFNSAVPLRNDLKDMLVSNFRQNLVTGLYFCKAVEVFL
jgi:hypothetical protein